MGCLKLLDIDVGKYDVIDTLIAAKLANNNRFSYSLDSLSEAYNLSTKKDSLILIDAAEKAGLLTHLNKETKTYRTKALKWCYANMHKLQEYDIGAVAKYAAYDILATSELFKKLVHTVSIDEMIAWSWYQVLCVHLRAKGVVIDLTRLKVGLKSLEKQIADKLADIYAFVGEEFNVNSIVQLADKYKKLGIRVGETDKGHPSITKAWLVDQSDKLSILVKDYREASKIYNDFFLKINDMQVYTCPNPLANKGRIFPELNLFGAQTGRFSSSNPNIQQIPKYGKLCRDLFVSPNDQFIACDFASQEIRLQVHYAALSSCSGSNELLKAYIKNPSYDLHTVVAELAKIDRKHAKTINLGLSYGMGLDKLATQLGVSYEAAAKIVKRYHLVMPYLKELTKKVSTAMDRRGCVKTIGGRSLKTEGKDFNYKALNKLIQGSAADQCLLALKHAWEDGINIIFPVHDEICAYGTEEDAQKLKSIMESCIKLELPVVADISIGPSWGSSN
jgi:DNA polymerase-1